MFTRVKRETVIKSGLELILASVIITCSLEDGYRLQFWVSRKSGEIMQLYKRVIPLLLQLTSTSTDLRAAHVSERY